MTTCFLYSSCSKIVCVPFSSPGIEANHTPEQDESRRRKGGTSEVESIHNNTYRSTTSQPVLEAKHNIEKQTDLTRQPFAFSRHSWYFGNITSEQAGKCLLAAGNGDGSFLVMDSNGKPDKYILKVKFNGEVKSRMICVSQSGFWIEKQNDFPTVTSLIDHYREHAGCFPTNLSLPCVRTSNIP
ncbi:hypothetical protein V1264_024780 [Littorina saxatilis]|uniref:SH2 domain-containing protein n=1 Tax=Littorina saxatilis TaxID=31220 RepID=A0AAN9AL70_9CAEN